MCGRYYVNDEMAAEIEKVVRELDRRNLHTGEIYPGQKASVIASDGEIPVLRQMEWGFCNTQRKGLIINAKSETVLEKRMFAESIRQHRCIVPASWFYEWDKDKNKAVFRPERDRGLFMAGFWNHFSSSSRFVILTTEANEYVKPVHERMPLLVSDAEAMEWLREGKQFESLLKTLPDTVLEVDGFIQTSLKWD